MRIYTSPLSAATPVRFRGLETPLPKLRADEMQYLLPSQETLAQETCKTLSGHFESSTALVSGSSLSYNTSTQELSVYLVSPSATSGLRRVTIDGNPNSPDYGVLINSAPMGKQEAQRIVSNLVTAAKQSGASVVYNRSQI